ncbi:MAG: deoxyribonuclease IV [Porphyromonas sp.]|nr:deoxyribonuclease IV [Porphyromonas sp.]
MKYIGAHVSASGGVENAPLNAQAIGAKAFALFVKNQRQWTAPPLSDRSIALFIERCQQANIQPKHILPHDSYLINMGNPSEEARLKSINAFIDEMERCNQLGLQLLNFHPGSHLNQISEEECLDFIAQGVNKALDIVPNVTAVIENVAGQGSNVGYTFEQLNYLISRINDKTRVGVCLDTAHTLASGYEIRTQETYNETLQHFDDVVGIQYLKAIHLNDSKKELGSRVDRHESMGMGVMGMTLFSSLMKDPRMNNIPIILETPLPELWSQEISQLYDMPGAK